MLLCEVNPLLKAALSFSFTAHRYFCKKMHNINFFPGLNPTAESSLLVEYEVNCFHPTHPDLVHQSVAFLAHGFLLFLGWHSCLFISCPTCTNSPSREKLKQKEGRESWPEPRTPLPLGTQFLFKPSLLHLQVPAGGSLGLRREFHLAAFQFIFPILTQVVKLPYQANLFLYRAYETLL